MSLVVLVCAQTADAADDDGCSWLGQNQQLVTNGYSVTSNVGINAFFWNDGTGKLYRLFRVGTTSGSFGDEEVWEAKVSTTEITL